MKNVLKALVVTTSLTLVLTTTNVDKTEHINEHLLLDNFYACQWWPMCRDPDQLKPMPSDNSVPKPSGDKDNRKDKKDLVQLA